MNATLPELVTDAPAPPRILIVEDDALVRVFVAEVLASRGYVVETAANMVEAEQRLHTSPDLLVVDVLLPDGCGLDLIPRTRARSRVPAIVISGGGDEDDYGRGFAAGADDYLAKPFSKEELLARVAVHLARRAQRPAKPTKSLASGRYRLERELGRGAYGRVYLAHDQGRAGELVAVKLLVPPPGEEEEARLRFIRETHALSRIVHPGVVRVLDVGTEGDTVYYAMEHVEGSTLHDHVSTHGPLSERDAQHLAAALLDALVALEEVGILHRDVKPANIMLRGGDLAQPVVIDFGLATGDRDVRSTSTDAIVGTLAYMAPEAIMGRVIDHRTDLFALGLTLRFALEGRDAFPGLDGFELMKAMSSTPVAIPERVSRPFATFLAALLRIDRCARPRSASHALRWLRLLGLEPAL